MGSEPVRACVHQASMPTRAVLPSSCSSQRGLFPPQARLGAQGPETGQDSHVCRVDVGKAGTARGGSGQQPQLAGGQAAWPQAPLGRSKSSGDVSMEAPEECAGACCQAGDVRAHRLVQSALDAAERSSNDSKRAEDCAERYESVAERYESVAQRS